MTKPNTHAINNYLHQTSADNKLLQQHAQACAQQYDYDPNKCNQAARMFSLYAFATFCFWVSALCIGQVFPRWIYALLVYSGGPLFFAYSCANAFAFTHAAKLLSAGQLKKPKAA